MNSLHLIRETMREASYELSDSRRMCCRADLQLINDVLNTMHGQAHESMMNVVQLGAGSGTMALIVMANRHTEILTTVDHDQQNLNWERQVLENCGWDKTSNYSENSVRKGGLPYYSQKLSKTVRDDWQTEFGPWGHDLIIVDADHSYESVKADLECWRPMANPKCTFFIHDYRSAVIHEPFVDLVPEEYPGVKQAADEFFGRDADMVRGWSGIFFNDVTAK